MAKNLKIKNIYYKIIIFHKKYFLNSYKYKILLDY